LGVPADKELGSDRHLVEQRFGRQLGGQDLNIVPLGELGTGNAHGPDLAMVPGPAQSVLRQLMNQPLWTKVHSMIRV